MGMVANNLYNFCNTEKDAIYLWQCKQNRVFLTEFERYLKEKCLNCNRLNLTPAVILFGYDEKTKANAGFDYFLLAAKLFVSTNAE